MAKCRKQKQPEARALYAAGADTATIAAAVGASRRTVQRWAREGAEAGWPWQRDGEGGAVPARAAARHADPTGPERRFDRLCRLLEERLERLIESSHAAPDGDGGARLEDRMLKVCKVLDSLRAGRDMLSEQLEAMKHFAEFCLRTLTESEMAPVRKAIRLFADELKREHS